MLPEDLFKKYPGSKDHFFEAYKKYVVVTFTGSFYLPADITTLRNTVQLFVYFPRQGLRTISAYKVGKRPIDMFYRDSIHDDLANFFEANRDIY
jgi:hypothetical protein